MKICESCGAEQRNDAKFCSNCGQTFQNNMSVKTGNKGAVPRRAKTSNHEQGRGDEFPANKIASSKDSRSELISNLKRALNTIEKLNTMDSAVDSAEEKITELKQTVESMRSTKFATFITCVLWFVLFVYVFIPIYDIIYEQTGWEFFNTSTSALFPFFLTAILSGVIAAMITAPWKRKKRQKAEDYFAQSEPPLTEELKKKKLALKRYIDSDDVKHLQKVIPPDYATVDAVSFLIVTIQNFRADSLKEALNIYEEEKHKQELMAIQEEQIQLLNQNIEIGQKQLSAQQQLLKEQRQSANTQEALLSQTKKMRKQVRFSNAMGVINTVKHWKD